MRGLCALIFSAKFHFRRDCGDHWPIPFLAILIGGFLLLSPALLQAASPAQQLFEKLKPSVYQVRVIDIASGDKYSFGSGFKVTDDGKLITNFHVVSSYVHEPEKYRLEVLDNEEKTSSAELITIDVVHDLAVIKIPFDSAGYLSINPQMLAKGDRIYSMGNPLDLGMTIIEGTYNGLVKISRYQKILFSGSLNPGMSGGPAFDENGDIIGVNVSKGKEQISFLVPARHVISIIKESQQATPLDSIQQTIQNALIADQMKFYQPLLQATFTLDTLGQLKLPGKISPTLKCWGHTVDEEGILYQSTHQHCRSEDEIYIQSDFYTGTFAYDFEWLSRKDLNSFQFYHLVQERFQHKSLSNTSKEEHISNFHCVTQHVEVAAHDWKASSCLRAYKQYPGLYDALLLMSTVDMYDAAAIVKMSASGISQKNALALFRKMMDSIEWIN